MERIGEKEASGEGRARLKSGRGPKKSLMQGGVEMERGKKPDSAPIWVVRRSSCPEKKPDTLGADRANITSKES